MESIEIITNLLKDYDAASVAVILYIGYLLNKKIQIIDKSVNCRPEGSLTLSQEVSEIHRKVDVLAVEVKHVKKEVDEHRKEDEAIIANLTESVNEISKRVA
jgi:hypothetical protein